MIDDFFPQRPKSTPTIYAYSDSNPKFRGLLKVGYTDREAQERLKDIYPIKTPGGPPYKIVVEESAMRDDGTSFKDHEVHRVLEDFGVSRADGEWFECSAKEVTSAISAVRMRESIEKSRDLHFEMRPEQNEAVNQTASYFKRYNVKVNGRVPHFLWNAKMRFGKTFAAYQLALRMRWRKVLIITFKPAVQSAWEEDLTRHIAFEGWKFLRPQDVSHQSTTPDEPFVCFGSFQDFLGRNRSSGGIKVKNRWVHKTHWDCVFVDEYHYGAWRENAKDLFESEDDDERSFSEGQGIHDFDEELLPITTNAYLYLSGTPFRAISSGEFLEDQIFNWTYSDEQRAKKNWQRGDNPYRPLPRMVLLTYQIPEEIAQIAGRGEYDEFDLNTFFAASGSTSSAKFSHESEVQKWLDLIRGAHLPSSIDDMRLGGKRPPMPFSDSRLLQILTHTVWFLPSVSSCFAMRNLLSQRQNTFYSDYKITVAAGPSAGIGVFALNPVKRAMGNPLCSKTITLTCGKLTTGVTVRPWSGIFMLRNSSSPETYFQAAFRVQSPWTVMNPSGLAPNEEEILKKECYVFDFAPIRALRQIVDYSCRLDLNDKWSPEQKVMEFIEFLPVLAYDGSSMKQIDAAGIMDMATSGTTASLLARRWESALLVNVDNETLQRLINNEQALQALMNLEGFRNLNNDIEIIINKSNAVKNTRRKANDKKINNKKKRELTESEKQQIGLRKEIQTKLIKFATRIPIFMYLTDHRERCLKDIITRLEPRLFKRVTGLTVRDFELLVSLGVFNSSLMNDAVFKFKCYEDSSLSYTGINRHSGSDIGLYDTVLTESDVQAVIEATSEHPI